jgi:hypothetical protein
VKRRTVTGAQVRAVAKAAAARRPVELQTLLFGSYVCERARCKRDAYYAVRYSDDTTTNLCTAHAPAGDIPRTMQRSPTATTMRSFRLPDNVYLHLREVADSFGQNATEHLITVLKTLRKKGSES